MTKRQRCCRRNRRLFSFAERPEKLTMAKFRSQDLNLDMTKGEFLTMLGRGLRQETTSPQNARRARREPHSERDR